MAHAALIFSAFVAVTAADFGPSCLQPKTLNDDMRGCFIQAGIKNVINLDPTDKSGTMGQMSKIMRGGKACSMKDKVVNGMSCFFDSYGNCLHIRDYLPSSEALDGAISYACENEEAMGNACLQDVDMKMMSCYLDKVKERQMAIMFGKAHVGSLEDETCNFLKEEMKCLSKALTTCPKEIGTIYYNFMDKLMPKTCTKLRLLKVLRQSTKLNHSPLFKMKSRP